MAELTPEQKKALAVATARKRLQDQKATPAYSGSILPMSRMEDGSVRFDSDAGILGAVKRAVTLPGEVMRGEVPVRDRQGNITDEAIGRSLEMGAVVAPTNPMVRSGDKVIPGVATNLKKGKVSPPTAEQLLRAGGEGFDAMRATGAEYPASAVKQVAESLMIKLNQQGFDDTTAPATFRTLQRLASPPGNSVATIGGLHSARKTFGKIGQNFNTPADQSAARAVIDEIDGFIRGPVSGASGADDAVRSAAGAGTGDSAFVAGGSDAQRRAASLLDESNRNYAAGKRSDLIQGIERAADLRAAAANSGQNTGNTIRQRVASALLREKDTAGFNAAEKDALEGIVRGSRSANATRDIANRLGGGGGLGSAWTSGMGGAAGYAIGSQFGAPGMGAAAGAAMPAVAGGALKGASNRITQRALRNADEAIRMRSPLYEKMVQEMGLVAPPTRNQQAIIKTLLLSQMPSGGGGGGGY